MKCWNYWNVINAGGCPKTSPLANVLKVLMACCIITKAEPIWTPGSTPSRSKSFFFCAVNIHRQHVDIIIISFVSPFVYPFTHVFASLWLTHIPGNLGTYIYMHIHIYIYMQLHVCTHITQRCICTKYIHTHTYYIYIYYIRKLHSSLNITSSPTQPTWCPPCLTSSSCHWPHGACGTAECQESRHRDPRPGDGSTDGHLFASNTSSPAQRFGWEQPSFYWI